MNHRALFAICAAGFVLRLIYLAVSGSQSLFPDELRFLEEGYSLVKGLGLQADGKLGHDMPLTGLVIAASLFLSGESVFAVKLVMVVISTLTIAVVARLCFEISKQNRSALIAAAICSIYPFFIFYSARILSETIFLFFMTLFFWALIRQSGGAAWQGALAGLMHLTRPVFLYFLPIIWVWQYFFQRLPIKNIAFGIVIMTLVISPWIVRNYVVFGEIVIGTASSGHILWEGNNPWNTTGGVSGTFDDTQTWLDVVPGGMSELAEDQWKKSEAIAFIKEEPTQFLKNGFLKLKRFWSLWPNSGDHQHWLYKLVSVLSFGSVLLLSVVGAVVLKKHRKEVILICAAVGYLTALHALILGSIRYRLPLEPLLIVLASITLVNLWGRYSPGKG